MSIADELGVIQQRIIEAYRLLKDVRERLGYDPDTRQAVDDLLTFMSITDAGLGSLIRHDRDGEEKPL